MLQTEITSSNYITGCEAKEERSRRWKLAVEKHKIIEKQTVVAEVAETLGSSGETKEFRISCFSPRPKSPVDTELSIGRGCCYGIAIHFGVFLIKENDRGLY